MGRANDMAARYAELKCTPEQIAEVAETFASADKAQEEIPEKRIVKDAKPVGVIACVIPATNPGRIDAKGAELPRWPTRLSALSSSSPPRFLVLLKPLQILFYRPEACGPESLIGIEPAADLPQRFHVQAIDTPAACAARRDESRALQDGELLRDGRQRDVERFGEAVHGLLAVAEFVQQSPPHGAGDGLKDVVVCQGSSHIESDCK
jgi:hypothetical protein